jgi:hypothetical protein
MSALSVRAQYTAIPDVNFELALIEFGVDSEGVQDGQVLTADLISITELDLRKWNDTYGQYVGRDIHDLTGIAAFVNLETLYINYNPVDIIDLSQNIALKRLDASTYLYETVDTPVPGYEDLTHPNFGALDLSANINLEYFYAMRTGLTAVNFGSNVNLIDVIVNDNFITNLDLSGLPNLRSLLCGSNYITILDLSYNTELLVLNVSRSYFGVSGHIQNIIYPDNPKLISISLTACYDVDYTPSELDFSDFQYLMRIYISEFIPKINIANGNNHLNPNPNPNSLENFFFYFNYYGASGSACVQVDTPTIADEANADTNSWNEYGDVTYSTDCGLATVGAEVLDTLQVYPNPSDGRYTVSLAHAQIASIVCYNSLGQQIAKSRNSSINIVQAKKGLYILVIKTVNGGVFTKKVMKD